jgi:hypothetical protein
MAAGYSLLPFAFLLSWALGDMVTDGLALRFPKCLLLFRQ